MCRLNIAYNYRPVRLRSINETGDVLLQPNHCLRVGSEFGVSTGNSVILTLFSESLAILTRMAITGSGFFHPFFTCL